MVDYFTSDQFKLLNRWKGQKRDDSNPEQNRAYEELKKAYEVTDAWANGLKAALFPLGRVEIRKRPTNQGNHFAAYNWARIYPSSEAPKELAYTVGIDAVEGFIVKIDTVGLDESSPTRLAYLALRGVMDNTSPFVSTLPVSEGLARSLDQLVDWSAEAIRGFRLHYDEVVAKLSLGKALSDETLLKHFDSKPAFQKFRALWSSEERDLFCRLARSVHEAGLDWWHVGIGTQVRFGRKAPGSERAAGVLGIVQGVDARKIEWTRTVGSLEKFKSKPLTEALVEQVEAALTAESDDMKRIMPAEGERPGLWPDQLREEPADPSEEREDEAGAVNPSAPINRIYYGPPGTGKTYELSKLLKRDYVQAMDKVPFGEWRTQFFSERVAGLTWWEGAAVALADMGGKAQVDAIIDHPIMKAIAAAKSKNQNVRNTVWGALQYHSIESSTTVKMSMRTPPAIFDKESNSTWTLTGEWDEVGDYLRAIAADYKKSPPRSEVMQRYSFVTFHQSYGYEEFVEGLRPILNDEGGDDQVRYEIRPGAFKELCRRARSAPDRRFAMVIDEINRGNISKIFGELITLIEPDKREGAEHAVSLTLPYSAEPFSVPPNVDIIGTMNTADRSLALLDTALRRRFDFVPVMPDVRDEPRAPLGGLRVTLGDRAINVPRMLEAINLRIQALYDRDHCIGHAYFTHLAKVPDGDERLVALQRVFSTRLLPLLEEYFFEDWQKIRLVLADNQKPAAAQFVRETVDHEDDLVRLFGGDHGLDSYATNRRYVMQDAAFSNPDAYIGVYQTLSA
jgi:5-methylcytosine-specific restriction protein B